MAYREAVQDEDLSVNLAGANFFWNISDAVGWGCPNRQLDVMLVQYLLHKALSAYGRPTKNGISMDGIFGPQTSKWIKKFQADTTWTGIDGKVDAVGGSRSLSTKTKKMYTIHWLNFVLMDNDSTVYQDITIDPSLPAELCSELSKIVVDDVVAV